MSALYRSAREFSRAYLLAKFGFDIAENEPCEVCPIERCSSRARGHTEPIAERGRGRSTLTGGCAAGTKSCALTAPTMRAGPSIARSSNHPERADALHAPEPPGPHGPDPEHAPAQLPGPAALPPPPVDGLDPGRRAVALLVHPAREELHD